MKKYIINLFQNIEIPIYLFFILVYPFLFITYGLHYTDGPYHWVAYNGSRPPSDMTFLYAIFGNAWMHIAGDSVLSYRILSAILIVVMTSLPTLIILKMENSWKEKLRFISIGVILITTMAGYALGWNDFSRLFLSLIFIIAYFYIKKDGLLYLVILGIFTGIVVAIRFPNITIIIPLLLIIVTKDLYSKSNFSKILTKTSVYVLSSGFIYSLLWVGFIEYGGTDYSDYQVNASITSISLGKLFDQESGYFLLILLRSSVRSGFRIIEMIAVITLIMLIWQRRSMIIEKSWMVNIGIITFFCIYFYNYVLGSGYHFNLSYFYSAFIILMIALLFYDAKKKKNYNMMLFCFLTAMIGFVSAAGSNTGLRPLAGTYVFTFPIILFYVMKIISRDQRKIIYILLSLVVFFSLLDKTIIGNTYEDGKIWQLKATVNHPKLQGIQTTEARKQQIEDILGVVDSIKVKKGEPLFFFYGGTSHLFSYLTDSWQHYGQPFNMSYQNTNHAEAFGNYISRTETKPYVFLIFGYPEIKYDYLDGGLINEKLGLNSYTLIREGHNYQLFGLERN